MANEWIAAIRSLRKAHLSLATLSLILGKEGVDALKSGRFYLAIVQTILMFWRGAPGSYPEHWTTTGRFPPQGFIEDINKTAVTLGLW